MMNLDDFDIPDDLLDAVEAASANPYLTNPAAGMGLIARLLAAPAPLSAAEEPLAHLRQLIHQEFDRIVPFCGPSGAAAARELVSIGQSIEELALFPDLANKLVVGIGGGFSAGKSRFLNTLLGIDMLPEGLGPTTAIPTCLADGGPAVRAQNLMNRMVPVTGEELQALAHGFDRQYKSGDGDTFGLAHLIKLLVIQQPSMRWNNLVLLDTPGYDKPDGEPHSLTDEEIARQHLSQADHVVWLVNARNGALRSDDIRFLRSVDLRQPVFFVVTQADLQAATALPGILRLVEEAATAAGIDCAGVMGWAAPQGAREGKIIAGYDINQWLDGLDLQPRLMDKRRSAARVMDPLSEYLESQVAEGRDELVLLNAYWPVANQLSEDTAEGIRRLLARRRDSQREHAARIVRLGEFRRDLDDALMAVLDAISLDDARSEDAVEHQYQEAMLALDSRHGQSRDAEAFSSLLDAACHEHVQAQYAVAECYRLGTGTAIDPVLAFSWCRKAAGHGMPEAQYLLGNCYLTGGGVVANPVAALSWYQAAAEQGHLGAQMELFACHARELDTHLDLPVAIGWLKRAALQDSAEAQFELGKCYRDGIGIAKNRRTANKLFTKAAEQEHALAQHALGLACLDESDDDEAVRWFRLAAKQELPEAMTDLARCYLDGRGVAAHRGHAASWFRKAERLGHVPAITGLGHCHFEAEELDLAVRCYRRAAEQEDGEGRFRLGECYLAGDGVRKNRSRAMHWFELAEEQGYTFPYDVMPSEAA
jgi:TPR repeat protein